MEMKARNLVSFEFFQIVACHARPIYLVCPNEDATVPYFNGNCTNLSRSAAQRLAPSNL
jgi:hypothetical protein